MKAFTNFTFIANIITYQTLKQNEEKCNSKDVKIVWN